jgi:isocitrate dehydrogenase (NAD+)
VQSPYSQVDLVIVRENTEDLYAGIEFAEETAEARELIQTVQRLSKHNLRDDTAITLKPISRFGSERICRFAFEYAKRNGRRKVTCVHKANIMKATDGLFLRTFQSVAAAYSGQIAAEDRIVDNLCMQLVQRPQDFDVLVLPNIYGDIVSDLCAGLIGGLGVAPGANIGEGIALFEPTHGSAPKYAGQNKVNPTATILSAALMLRYLGEAAAADRLERAVQRVIREGRAVTYDLKSRRDDPTAVGTSQMADAIIAAMRSAS